MNPAERDPLLADEPESDVERLRQALIGGVLELADAVGLPGADGERVQPPDGPEPVNPDLVPAGALYCARKALDLIGLALSTLATEPELHAGVTVEEGLAVLTRTDPEPFGRVMEVKPDGTVRVDLGGSSC